MPTGLHMQRGWLAFQVSIEPELPSYRAQKGTKGYRRALPITNQPLDLPPSPSEMASAKSDEVT